MYWSPIYFFINFVEISLFDCVIGHLMSYASFCYMKSANGVNIIEHTCMIGESQLNITLSQVQSKDSKGYNVWTCCSAWIVPRLMYMNHVVHRRNLLAHKRPHSWPHLPLRSSGYHEQLINLNQPPTTILVYRVVLYTSEIN